MRIAGINFDHMHMGDLLRMVHEHPFSELVGVCDEQPERMQASIDNFEIPPGNVFTDFRECMEQAKPDIAILCPATAEHALWTERIASFGVHILVEKPFAASLAEADRMITAMKDTGKQLAINWPITRPTKLFQADKSAASQRSATTEETAAHSTTLPTR